MEIANLRNLVRTSRDQRAATSVHQEIEWCGTDKHSKAKRFAKGNSWHGKKGNKLTWTVLLVWISCSGHVRHTQTIKTSCEILTVNSKLGFLVCVRFGIIFQCRDLPNFSGGMLSSGATNHWKPQRFFGKRSGSWQVFSPYKSFGRKVFGYWNGKNLAFLIQFMYSTFDREIRAYGWKARPWCGRSFGSISLDDKGEIWKTAFHKISHPVQVRADRMFI